MFIALATLITIIFIAYAVLIFSYAISWKNIEFFNPLLNEKKFKTTVSIIVAARNEEQNISNLLNALSIQTYPKSNFEILIVDDNSEDGTVIKVNEFKQNKPSYNIKLLELKTLNPILTNKKAALSEAIKTATGTLIVTTDADCTMGSNWLSTIVAYYETCQPNLMVCPVMLEGVNFLENLQVVEFLSLMVLTGGSINLGKPLMCNGANLAYPKEIYNSVNGFLGNETVASGDDTFLMLKVKEKYNEGIHFVKSTEVIVKTQAQKTFHTFLNQRIRWASKTKHYKNKYIDLVGIIILLANLSLITLGLLAVFDLRCLPILMFAISSKIVADVVLLISGKNLLRKSKLNPFSIGLLTMVYPFYLLIVMLTKQSGYQWKGRDLK